MAGVSPMMVAMSCMVLPSPTHSKASRWRGVSARRDEAKGIAVILRCVMLLITAISDPNSSHMASTSNCRKPGLAQRPMAPFARTETSRKLIE